MRYCSRCLYPENHPLNLIIDDEGVCSGCRVHEEKDRLDWTERFDTLRRITAEFRSASGDNYDCIVPVSGARDSWFIVHVVRNVLGLKPLLTYYNSHWNTRLGTRNLAYMRIAFDCDMVGFNVSAETVRAVTRAALVERGSMYWHVLAGQTVWPVRAAIQFKVPLIIWGAHQGVDQVGMFSHLDAVEMMRKYRMEHDLMGLEVEDLERAHPQALSGVNLMPFAYPDNREIATVGVRGIYLNNYMRWDSKAQHDFMVRHFGYESAPQQRTFDTCNDVDSFHYSGLHDAIKVRKWGYGKVTDHATREIRLRRMTRAQGQEMVRQYQAVRPADTAMFCDWLGMPEQELWEHVDRQRDPRVWQHDGRDWQRVHSVLDDPQPQARLEAAALPPLEDWTPFPVTPNREPEVPEDHYVTIGKGYIETSGPHEKVRGRHDLPACSGVILKG